MTCAGTGHAARHNLRALRKIAAQFSNVFVIDMFSFINTECANFLRGLLPAGRLGRSGLSLWFLSIIALPPYTGLKRKIAVVFN